MNGESTFSLSLSVLLQLKTADIFDIIFLTSQIKIKVPDIFVLNKNSHWFMFPKLPTYRNSKVINITIQKQRSFMSKKNLD